MGRGYFIAIEGGDGSGKATQAKLLIEYLRSKNYDVYEADFPRYGEKSAYYVERYLNGDYGAADEVPADLGVLPYALDRFAAKKEIEAHLSKPNSIVVSNRYMGSNLAHQGAKISDTADRKLFYERTLHTEYDILGIPRPDFSIVLLVKTAIAQQNVDKKDTRGYTSLQRDIHEADASHLDNAKRNYEELVRLYPNDFMAINSMTDDGKQKSIETIQEAIVSMVAPAIKQNEKVK